ncbi:MAG: DUF4292 domain-containing protein [Polyangia bacterium]
MRLSFSIVLLPALALAVACGPVPRPADAYASAPDLLADFEDLRCAVRSLRAAGRFDHFDESRRVQGEALVFAELPDRLRVDLLSPFGSTLSVLTVDRGEFALSDYREHRFYAGPADPCNIARLIQVPLSPEDVTRALVGHTPLIEGDAEVRWDPEGRYRVTISDGQKEQVLWIDPDRRTLALRRSRLKDERGTIFDLRFDRWREVDGAAIPHEIEVEMPREEARLLLRYDAGGVEINVDLPAGAWRQELPAGATVEHVTCADGAT